MMIKGLGFFTKRNQTELQFKEVESAPPGIAAVAKIEQIEEILRLPLCGKCRSMIGGDAGSEGIS